MHIPPGVLTGRNFVNVLIINLLEKTVAFITIYVSVYLCVVFQGK